MPIYEFYCPRCHRIFNFFSRRINTEKIPVCPRCGKERLQRKMSVFSTSHGLEEDSLPDIDESRMEKAMNLLAKEAEKIDEERPDQAARLMRKLTDMMGIKLGEAMEEALRRMEKGEDPEKIEEEMGEILEQEDPFVLEGKSKKHSKYSRPPEVDEKLYEL